MGIKGEEEDGSGTLVSRVLKRLSGKRLTPPISMQSKTRPEEILATIPSDAGTRPNGSFDSSRFLYETGITPAEYVSHYLEANGSRVRQQALVGSLDWSDATVCRLIQSMENDGAVETCIVGREKIISLPSTSPIGATRP